VYSGAVPNEKITWGKLDIKTPKFIIESDATIVASYFCLFIRSIEYTYEKSNCDYAKTNEILNLCGKVSRWL
jgi:hypothetical protein